MLNIAAVLLINASILSQAWPHGGAGCPSVTDVVASGLADHRWWRYGAAYFEQQLIDYDVCSNWGNWAYQAGVGNDPRGKRYFDIEKQAQEYDKNNLYRNIWLSRPINNTVKYK